MADKQLWDFSVAVPAGTDVITFTTDPSVTPALQTVSFANLAALVGGGGAPVGNPNEFQYNNGGVFGGATGIEFSSGFIAFTGGRIGDNAGVIVLDGDYLELNSPNFIFLNTVNNNINLNSGLEINLDAQDRVTIVSQSDYVTIDAATTLTLTATASQANIIAGTSASITAATDVTITATGAVNISGATLGFFGVSAVSRASAYTQTYSTADKTIAALTATAVATTAATQTTPWGFSSQAQADAIVAAINAIIVDIEAMKKNDNAIIDDNQAYGLFQ